MPTMFPGWLVTLQTAESQTPDQESQGNCPQRVPPVETVTPHLAPPSERSYHSNPQLAPAARPSRSPESLQHRAGRRPPSRACPHAGPGAQPAGLGPAGSSRARPPPPVLSRRPHLTVPRWGGGGCGGGGSRLRLTQKQLLIARAAREEPGPGPRRLQPAPQLERCLPGSGGGEGRGAAWRRRRRQRQRQRWLGPGPGREGRAACGEAGSAPPCGPRRPRSPPPVGLCSAPLGLAVPLVHRSARP
ncbi:hypothetical protein NN561_019362 [Cricetulus griseus]